ncbi:MAG: hypothetical protein ACKVOL_14155 [Novosphingobium sp.]
MNTTNATRRRPQIWSLCFARLHAKPDWLESWLIGWGLLLTWGTFAFLIAPASIAVPSQTVFFAGLFPWIMLPVVTAFGRGRCAAN